MSILEGVEEQKEKRNVIYDFDGIIFLSCYAYKDSKNIELMYADCFMRLKSIEAEIWKSYAVGEVIISLTSKKNFRHDLTDRWKTDREAKPIKEMTPKQLEAHTVASELRNYVSQVKVLLNDRMASSPSYTVMVDTIQEADDRCIDYAKNDWLVVAMDSDVINQSPSPVFNYHSKHWKWMHEGKTEEDIFKHIITDTLTGGHNGSFGVKGCGKVGAEKFILQLLTNEKVFSDWVDLFETPAEALLNYQVASCSQVVDGKLKLMDIVGIAELFEEHFTCPF